MKPVAWLSGESSVRDPQNFSFVLGGPLYQLLRRAHLTDDALMLVRRRVIAFSLFAWLPLLLFSALERYIQGENAAMPFLRDIDVHLRFLVAMPLLIVAELVVHQRMRPLVRQFLDRRLIPENAIRKVPRCRRVGPTAPELGARRGAADRLRVWRRHPDRLAPPRGAWHCDVVRGPHPRGHEALARRDCGTAT